MECPPFAQFKMPWMAPALAATCTAACSAQSAPHISMRACQACVSGASAGGAGAQANLNPNHARRNTTSASPAQLSGVATGHKTSHM
jgi:hypothetical protein